MSISRTSRGDEAARQEQRGSSHRGASAPVHCAPKSSPRSKSIRARAARTLRACRWLTRAVGEGAEQPVCFAEQASGEIHLIRIASITAIADAKALEPVNDDRLTVGVTHLSEKLA